MSDDYSETAKRLHDIKRRIEELRASLYSARPEPAQRNDEVLEKPQDDEKRKRNAELDDIKAKLLGRKK